MIPRSPGRGRVSYQIYLTICSLAVIWSLNAKECAARREKRKRKIICTQPLRLVWIRSRIRCCHKSRGWIIADLHGADLLCGVVLSKSHCSELRRLANERVFQPRRQIFAELFDTAARMRSSENISSSNSTIN
jgi:hypothetical protein